MNAHSPQHSNQTPMSNVLLPDELIVEILSLLPVKFLIEFRSVCKSWKTLISEPTFIKLHLQQSSKTPQITLTSSIDCSIRPLPVHRLLDTTTTTSITLPDHNHFQLNHILDRGDLNVVGSSNGLLCFLGNFYSYNYEHYYEQIFLYLWNPATAELSNRKVFLNKVEHLPYYERFGLPRFRSWSFAFGYDNSTDTYKIVALNYLTSNNVKVWNSGRLNYLWGGDDDYGKGWRSIQSFPLIPLDNTDWYEGISNSVHVSGTLNWLAIRDDSPQSDYEYDWKVITIEQFVIVSLDLSTETYSQFLLPRGFKEVPHLEPSLVALMDSVCFCHEFHGTDLIIWQMRQFGVEESWIQFLKISYKSFSYNSQLVLYPLCLSENGDTLILSCIRDKGERDEHAILYNLRDGKVEKTTSIIYNLRRNNKTTVTNGIQWHLAKSYFESLVSVS